MISFEAAVQVHSVLIEQFGGSVGVRDAGALESALARPYQCFADEELYPTVLEKAASLIESILVNHPFVDGSKRTGYVLMRLLLLQNGMDISAGEEAKYDFVIDIASSKKQFPDILKWLDKNTIPAS